MGFKRPEDWVEGNNPMNYYSTIQSADIGKMNFGYTFSIIMRSLNPSKDKI